MGHYDEIISSYTPEAFYNASADLFDDFMGTGKKQSGDVRNIRFDDFFGFTQLTGKTVHCPCTSLRWLTRDTVIV